MAEFGWAYVSGSNLPQGPEKSVQVKKGDEFSGSANFTYDTSTNDLILSGNMHVSGTLFANQFTTNVTSKNVINLSATGSTSFGDTTDDLHLFRGGVTITASANSDLIYSLTTAGYNSLTDGEKSQVTNVGGNYFLSSSNANHLNIMAKEGIGSHISFNRVVDAALIVSGSSVFNDPVSLQGGLFGASPIDIYAPLRYKGATAADDLTVERGKFTGRVTVSSSNAQHGLFLEGAGKIESIVTDDTESDLKPELRFFNDSLQQTSFPLIDMRKFDGISAGNHPQLSDTSREHDAYFNGQFSFNTDLPILTGSNPSSSNDYSMTLFNTSRIRSSVDARRNAYQISFEVIETSFDPTYVTASAYGNLPSNPKTGSNTAYSFPFTTASYDNATDPKSILVIGSFANPGQDNRYGVMRGLEVFGNIIPRSIELSSSGKSNFTTDNMTLGHPVARWGDLYIHDNRKIRWGQNARNGSFVSFFKTNTGSIANRAEESTALLGYNTTSSMLELSGAPLLADGGLNITGSGYINFGLTTGSTGYGFRDNNGTLEFRNSGTGSWTEFGTGTGGGSTIGAAEDGNYTDGLFTDFTSTTPVGTPVDRFNEVLKILAPTPAPAVERINYEQSSGDTAKLSFDSSLNAPSYVAVGTAGGFNAIARNETYQAQTSGSNFRLGIYNSQNLSGIINFNTPPNFTNGNLSYASGAFGNAETGTLKLELNGTVIHSVNLSSLVGSGNPATGSASSLTSGSGFTNVSVTASSFDGNGAEWYIFKHRTAKYLIEGNDQNKGWNYLRVVHTVGSTDYASNYVEWVNDPDGAGVALTATNPRVENVSTSGSVYLSGIQYNTSISANYKVDVNNIYRNVYPTGTPISFLGTRTNNPASQALQALADGEARSKVASITASIASNTNSWNPASTTFGCRVSAEHPLKSNLSNTGQATVTGFLIYNNNSQTTTNLSETFVDEVFRVTSGSYDNQASVTAGAATWSSQNHMTASGATGHENGLLQIAYSSRNGELHSPRSTYAHSNGNFTGITYANSGQPNYSTVTNVRTYYRKIQNTSGGTVRDMKITTSKFGTTFNNSSLGSANAQVFMKIPGSTGWMDISQNFAYGSVSDGNGALISGASNDVDNGNNVHHITFGTASVADDEYVVYKLLATSSWGGFLRDVTFQFGASAETAATPQVLSDIDANDTGTSAKLSFGSSNAVAGYSNVAGSGIGSMSTFNSNGDYTVSGDRRGIFSASPTIDGEINDAIAGDGGSDYPAKAFFNAYSGSLVLEVNGSDVHTIDLTSTLSAINTTNGQSSRLSVSALNFSTTSDDIPDYTKPYRTGTYEVAAGDQRAGWNYARLKHGSNTTNYVEWVVDASGAVNNSAVSTPALSDFGHTSIYYQSGIRYFASRPTGSFTYSGSNFYSNVYSRETDAISFGTTTNCSITNIRATGTGVTTFDSGVSQASMPALNNSADCEATTLQVTGTVLFDHTTSISGGLGIFTKHNVSVASTLKHPFKTNRTTSAASKIAFMVYSGSIGSTTLTNNEYFNTEDYRIVSGNYANQSEASSSTNTWNSQTAMNNGGTHDDGMVSVNGYAISPFQIGVSGNTAHADLQAPAGNPNYSTLTNNTRTFYRLFRYTGVSNIPSLTMTLYGDATLVAKSGTYAGSLGANKNVFVELKVPFDPNFSGADDQSTLWGDTAKIASGGDPPHVADGAGLRTGETTGEDQSIDSNGLPLSLTLGSRRIKQNQYYIVKISAHKDWTGYISRIQVAY
jgi:hypothetical protein